MRALLVTGALLLGLAVAGPAGAAVIHVNCAHANLQNKINSAPAGSTLKIQGRCVGEFLVNKNLNLVGDPNATLDGNDAGCIFTALPSDILNKPAKLGPLGKYGGPTQTIPLQSGSPARNAIPVAKCQVSKDQRGVKRPQGPRCDIGAFEVRR
jgi:hypothetical protein